MLTKNVMVANNYIKADIMKILFNSILLSVFILNTPIAHANGPKGVCYNKSNCGGKVINKSVGMHNCKQQSGKSWFGSKSTNEPAQCHAHI